MYYTIYRVTNKINHKFYIGKHQTTNINDSYMGSGRAIVNAIKRYGRENFYKEILFVFDNEQDMNNKEKELITEDFVNRSDTYNLGIGGEGGAHFRGRTHSAKSKNKISKSLIGKSPSSETRKKLSEKLTGRVFSLETRKKLSEKRRLRSSLTPEHKSKISETLKRIKADECKS